MILIIRPKTETNIIVNDLKERNCQFFLEPISKINFVNIDVNLHSKDFYLISSIQAVNAITKSKKFNHNFLNDINFFVIGNKTAQRLKSFGAKNIKKIFFSSIDLIDYLEQHHEIVELNHLTGSIKNDILDDWSKTKERLIKKTILYNIRFEQKLSYECRDHIKNKKFDTMFHYSLSSAEIFFSLLNNYEREYFTSIVDHFCLSKRIADGLVASGVSRKRIFFPNTPEHNTLMLQFDHTRTQISH